MRILDNNSDNALCGITLYLTLREAEEMRGYLDNLLSNPSTRYHVHMNDVECAHELTMTVYDEMNLDGYNQRSIRLIREGK